VHRIVRLAETEGIRQRHPLILMHNQPIGNPATVAALPVIIRISSGIITASSSSDRCRDSPRGGAQIGRSPALTGFATVGR